MLIRARRPKMQDDELIGIVNMRLATTSASSMATTFAADRAKAMAYYRGDAVGLLSQPNPGRSSVVSRDVQETVDGLMPALIKVFASGPPVEMRPRRQESEKHAEQATDLCQYVWNVQNPGFLNYYTWFKDSLQQRLGVLKIYWDATKKYTTETYEGVTQVQLQMLEQDDDVDIVAIRPYEDDPASFEVECRVCKMPGQVKIDPIPPDSFLFDYSATSLDRGRVVGDMWEYTTSELLDLGYDPDVVDGIPPGAWGEMGLNSITRYGDRGSLPAMFQTDADPASVRRWVSELYMAVDYDGDGHAEMRRIVVAGPHASVLLENEEVDGHPYAVLTPTIMPHRIEGMSVADSTMDIQEIKTALLRGTLDGMYSSINSRHEVVEGQVNIEDMLNIRPNGVVRVRAPGMIKPLDTSFNPDLASGMIAYMDKVRELRTGLPQSPGQLSDDVIAQDGGATGAAIINDARMERVELIARTFAETGVQQAFRRILELSQKYQDKPLAVRLRGSWTDINPREWADGFDLEIKVGLGSGNKDQMLRHLLPIKQTQEAILLQLGPDNPLVSLDNYHNTLQDMVKNAGLGDAARYFTNPRDKGPSQPKPPPPDPAMMKVQAEIKLAEMKAQSSREEAQQKMELARLTAENDMALERFKAEAKITLERENAVAQAAITANQELARSGQFGNAAQDGLAPDVAPQDDGDLEALLSEGVTALEAELAAAMQADPAQGMADINQNIMSELQPSEISLGSPAQGALSDNSEDAMQTQILAQMAETMRQQGEQMTQAVAAMAQAVAKIGGPRTVRRGKDGKIEGVE